MKPFRILPLVLISAASLILPTWQATAQSEQDSIDVARSVIKADRQAVVTRALQLTESEAKDFWPLYQQYRAEMDKVGDQLLALVHAYAKEYPDVPVDHAKEMLKDLIDLEKKQVTTRASFLKKFGKVLPAPKNLRFAQVESRLDLAIRLQLAASIPLVPIEGRISGELDRAAAVVQGVPGAAAVQTYQLTATVIAIDQTSRKVTLLSKDGIKQTVRVGPEAINFDQIHVHDTLRIEATQQLVVQVAGSGESTDSGGAAVVALAPKGAKPGGVMAETTQVTGTVTAIDTIKHTATLRFEDGSTRTFPVRADVNLAQRKVGEKVVFRVTEMVAITVEKP